MIRIGQVIQEKYRVDQVIGSGGMGVVYQVWDLIRNVPLAMKVLNMDVNDDPAQLRRFQREANALKKLSHPHIVPFYGFEVSGDAAFLLERYVDGADLKQVLGTMPDKRLTVAEALVYLKAVCAALGYAHNFGVVHCDIKPGNVMIDQGGNIYLTDFGIARHAESTSTTFGGAGTPTYMAPEQIRGEAVSAATDLYGLGVTLFEMLTGQRPFRGDEKGSESSGSTAGERVRYAHQYLAPPDPRTINPAISPAMAQVILRALAKDPSQRYQSTNELFLAACNAAGMHPDQLGTRVALPAGINLISPSSAATHPPQSASTSPAAGYSPAGQAPVYPQPGRSYAGNAYGQPAQGGYSTASPAKSGTNKTGLIVAVIGVIIVIVLIAILVSSNGGNGGGNPPVPTIGAPGELPPVEPPSSTRPLPPSGGISPPNEPAQEAQFTQDAMMTIAAETVVAEVTNAAETALANKPNEMPMPTETPPPPPPTQTPLPTPTIPPPLVSGATQTSAKDGMVIVYIDQGEFMMGSQGDPLAKADEDPQHRVLLDAYWIDKTEVTNAMFSKFVNATGYRTEAELRGSAKVYNGSGWDDVSGASWQNPRGPSSGLSGMDNYPVVMISYLDATQYCQWAGGRLPSEAEWEKASRGSSGQIYPWGNQSVSPSLANYNNMVGHTTAVTDYAGGSSPYGLLNVSGNVWEWVFDWYDPSFYGSQLISNPFGPNSSPQGMRTLRGGSWTSPAIDMRSASRSATTADNAKDNIGFRCVRFP